jgi:hypothetical protein
MFAAYEAYQYGLYRPQIMERGHVEYRDWNSKAVTAATRRITIRNRSFWQVEVTPGVWKDCGRDCADTLRKWTAAANG